MGSPRLVLWDIDQTLIEGGTVTHAAYAAAFHQATGREIEQSWRFDGRTELAAATEVLQAHGLSPDDGLLETFLDLILTEIQSRADELAVQGRALPGAHQALAAVGSVAGVHQSVLTGNLFPVAVLKLTLFDLSGYLDTRVGAYGGDAYDRSELPRYALLRARRHLGHHYLGSHTTIIGDTPRDVHAAQAVGARAVGVATGTTTSDELYAAGADVVLTDLTNTQLVLEAVTT